MIWCVDNSFFPWSSRYLSGLLDNLILRPLSNYKEVDLEKAEPALTRFYLQRKPEDLTDDLLMFHFSGSRQTRPLFSEANQTPRRGTRLHATAAFPGLGGSRTSTATLLSIKESRMTLPTDMNDLLEAS